MGVLFFQIFLEYYAYKQHANFFSHLVNQLVKYFFLSPEVNYGHVKTSRLQKNWICPVDFYVWDAFAAAALIFACCWASFFRSPEELLIF